MRRIPFLLACCFVIGLLQCESSCGLDIPRPVPSDMGITIFIHPPGWKGGLILMGINRTNTNAWVRTQDVRDPQKPQNVDKKQKIDEATIQAIYDAARAAILSFDVQKKPSGLTKDDFDGHKPGAFVMSVALHIGAHGFMVSDSVIEKIEDRPDFKKLLEAFEKLFPEINEWRQQPQQNAAPLPRDPQTGHSDGER